jgi:hypothetical protein
MYEDSYEPNLAEFAFGAPDLSLASSGGGGFGDLDASLWRDAGLGFMGYEMPGTGAAPNNGLSLSPDGYQAFNGMDQALWGLAGLGQPPAQPTAPAAAGSIPWTYFSGIPPAAMQAPFSAPFGLAPQSAAPNGLAFPAARPANAAQAAAAQLAPAAQPRPGAFPDGQLPGMGQLPNLPRNNATGFRSWDGNAGPNGGPQGGAGGAAGNDALARLVAAQNQNLAAARNAALADRHRALTSAQSLRNPYDAAFQDKARLQQQDDRGRPRAAAEATLVAQYAQMGRVVDPATLAMLRMRVAQADNADLRNLQLATTGASFAADLSRNDALYRVLAETNYLPGNLDPALMLQLARANGIANN